ncbi:MAG: TPM domain-containing protein [Clostridia bacterium]|nr:TPM domain-containing protein [Clostridia bacterium]
MKRFICLTFSLIFVLLLCLPVYADLPYNNTIYRFNDYAGYVSEEDANILNNKIDENIDALKMDFPICILDTYDYDEEPSEYADWFYQNNNFGYGETKDGVLLLLDIENSRYNIYYFGNAENIFTDDKSYAVIKYFENLVKDSTLSNYDVFDRYLDKVFGITNGTDDGALGNRNGMPYWYPENVESFENYHAENPPRVVDNAGILTDEQKTELEEQVNRIVDTYDFSYVIFIDDELYGLSKDVYAADFIYFGGYGTGDDYSAVCFFLCLKEGDRGWRTVSTNSYEDIFTSDITYTIDEIVDSDMRNGNYFEALKKQADYIEESLSKGHFESIREMKKRKIIDLSEWQFYFSIIFAFIVTAIVIASMRGKMKLNFAVEANEYLVKDSFNLKNKSVDFLYSKITRTKKEKRSSSGGSSYSSGSSSSGGSYSSGGRDF